MSFDYWAAFLEYAELERAAGGPDPQIEVIARALEPFSEEAAVRGAGMFANCYTVAGAAALWGRGPVPLTAAWLDTHGMGIGKGPLGLPMRRERRSVYGAAKFIRAHEAWLAWAENVWPAVRHEPYPVVYASVQEHVIYFGRYATMKVLEVLYRRRLLDHGQSDVRPRGAKFPRRTLARLFPEHAALCLETRDERPETLALLTKLGEAVQERVGGSYYDVETLLCTFRQCLTGKYPGRSQDRELAMWRQAEAHFQNDHWDRFLPFYELRRQLFDHRYLGELGDPPWYGARDAELAWQERYPGGVAY